MSKEFKFILIPGPIVELIVTFLINIPFSAFGLDFIIVSIKYVRFSSNFLLSKETLPITE